MNILGDKVILRAITMRDAPLLVGMINDAETERMLGGASFPVSPEAQEKWIISQMGRTDVLRTIVALKEAEEEGLGTVILSDIDYRNGTAQIHLKMDKEKGRGKGYGLDAAKAMIGYAFDELRLNCLYADILSYNKASQGLFGKIGFHKDGILRSRVFKDGEYIDMFSYSLLKKEYENA